MSEEREEIVNLNDGGEAGTPNPGSEDRGDVVAAPPAPDAAAAPATAPAAAPAATAPAPATGDGDDADPDGEGGAPERRPESIPKARFNEVNEQRKSAEARAERLEAELQQLRAQAPAPAPAPAAAAPSPFDLVAKEREFIQALATGDDDKALEIRTAINAHLVTEAETRVETRFSHRQAKSDLDAAASEAVAAYPWLNDAEHAETLDLIAASRDAKIAKGVPAGQALRHAVASIAPRFAPAAAAPAPGKGLAEAPAPEDTRPANAVRRGAADSQVQPPAVQAGLGNRATAARIDVAALTEAQFAALPDAEKRKLRGD